MKKIYVTNSFLFTLIYERGRKLLKRELMRSRQPKITHHEKPYISYRNKYGYACCNLRAHSLQQ